MKLPNAAFVDMFHMNDQRAVTFDGRPPNGVAGNSASVRSDSSERRTVSLPLRRGDAVPPVGTRRRVLKRAVTQPVRELCARSLIARLNRSLGEAKNGPIVKNNVFRKLYSPVQMLN